MEWACTSGAAIALSIVTATGTVFVTEIGTRGVSVAIIVIATLPGVIIVALPFVAAIDGSLRMTPCGVILLRSLVKMLVVAGTDSAIKEPQLPCGEL
jgi:hypothetical protein